MMEFFRATLRGIRAIIQLLYGCSRAALAGRKPGRDAVRGIVHDTGSGIMQAAGVPSTVNGLQHVPTDRGYVLISNHESHFDGPLIVTHVKTDFSIVAKKELFQIPIVGAGFRGFGFIRVDRENAAQSHASVDQATEFLQGGGAVLVFPEGHRTETGDLQEFKKGAVVMALKAGVPLLPVAIGGTREVLPIHSMHIKPAPVHLEIGAPIEVAGKTFDDRDEVLQECRAAVEELRKTARAHAQEARAIAKA